MAQTVLKQASRQVFRGTVIHALGFSEYQVATASMLHCSYCQLLEDAVLGTEGTGKVSFLSSHELCVNHTLKTLCLIQRLLSWVAEKTLTHLLRIFLSISMQWFSFVEGSVCSHSNPAASFSCRDLWTHIRTHRSMFSPAPDRICRSLTGSINTRSQRRQGSRMPSLQRPRMRSVWYVYWSLCFMTQPRLGSCVHVFL